MKFERVVVGPVETNCYVVWCEKTRRALVIDPGGDVARIKRIIERERLAPELIINTHGHYDHIGANGSLSLPAAIHAADIDCLTDPERNLSGMFLSPATAPAAVRMLNDGDVLEIGTIRLTVIHTPGHSPGSICLLAKELIFTGDTLFAGGVGRTDFPGGDEDILFASIRNRLLTLPDELPIHPGHGPSSTIGRERGWLEGE